MLLPSEKDLLVQNVSMHRKNGRGLGLKMATTSQVAEFYGVKTNSITHIANDNGYELLSDGYTILSGKEIKEKLVCGNLPQSKISYVRGAIKVVHGDNELRLSHGQNALFPKRAILRVGTI